MSFIYNNPINLNIPSLSFRQNPTTTIRFGNLFQDGFSTNPLNENPDNKAEIEALAKANPRVVEIMKKYKLPIKANMEELMKLQKGHLQDTRVIAAKIYSALPQEMKAEINLPHLQEAAMFHDYGKVLIPDKILNKTDRLTDSEREIMEQHSELGYELLKSKGLSKETLNLVKYHHQTASKNGYPVADANFEYTPALEILNVADKYSALTETRSYKPAMSKQEALTIIKEDVENGLVSEEIYNALAKAVA